MAHSFIKPEVIVDTTLALLETELVLGRTVYNVSDWNWSGTANDTITLRIPATLTARDFDWRTRGGTVQFDDLTETSYDVSIGGHVYSAVKVTDEQLLLDIADFAGKVLSPQTKAVARKLETNIVSAMMEAPYQAAVVLDPAASSAGDTTTNGFTTAVRKTPQAAVVAARKFLNAAGVPFDGRTLVIGTDLEELFLTSDQLVRYDESGSTSALRDATIGRIAGFEVIVSQQIAPTAGICYHRSAIAMAQMAPPVPTGVAFGAGAARDGYAMRWIRDYDPSTLQDRSVVSAFYGIQAINDGPLAGADEDEPTNVRAVRIDLD
jgi:hypothetical protein